MLYTKAASLLSLLVGAASVQASTGSSSTSLGAPAGFVQARGQEFVLDGKPFYFAGANSYWISFIANLSDVSKTMDEAKAAGLHVIRTWGFNDKNVTYDPNGLPEYGGEGAGPTDIVYQWFANGTSTINTDVTTGLGRFDKVVELAEKKGLKLIVALTNNWADYGGMDVYTVNLGGTYHDDFYTKPAIINAYKRYVKAVVSRYKSSPAIFAWELMNEPRCEATTGRNLPRSANCTSATLTHWIKDLSSYIKTIDPHHMVTVGDEGQFTTAGATDNFYNGSDGVDFNTNIQIPTVDFETFHLYPDWWSKTVAWGTQYVIDHATSMRKYNKPVIMEEYGWLTEADRIAYLGITSNITRTQAVGAWQRASVQQRLSGDLYWQFGTTDLSFGNSTDDGFTIYIQDAEAKVLVYEHAAAVNRLN
ncbi:glycoside hydrolase [Clavulina sp. PMI_390]|nr:glycoside hydrolase [Clavulina sp. PMI_390]